MSVKKLPKRKEKNPRVGCKRSPAFLMGTDFRNLSHKDVREIQTIYRRRLFTQKELARVFGVSAAIISKVVRCDPHWRG